MVESFEVLIIVFLFDSSFTIDITILQKTNLSNNFEGQNTKFCLRLRLLFVLAYFLIAHVFKYLAPNFVSGDLHDSAL